MRYQTPLFGIIAEAVFVSAIALCCLSACAPEPGPLSDLTAAAGSGVSAGAAGSQVATPGGAGATASAPPTPQGATTAAAASAAGMAAAGSGGAAATMGGTPAAAERGAPAWSAIFRDIIVAKGCQGASLCHGGPAGMLMMATRKAAYTALVDKPAAGMAVEGMACVDSGLKRVAPGDPDHSLLMQKILGTQTCGAVMPPNPPLLEPVEVEQIRLWIMGGAMDN